MKSLPRESIPIQFHRRAPSVGYGSRRYGRYPRTKWVSPDYSNHLSNVPSPLPRRIERVRMSITSPHHAAFPKWQEGRHPHCHFRGLRRLHSRYGPPDRSAAHRRPLSRGSNPCGYPHKPLVSYRINRQLSGWILPPLMIRAFGAHCQSPTSPLVARLQRALPAAQPPRT